jgi:G6PDH family F420-dependent oxidoreductase
MVSFGYKLSSEEHGPRDLVRYARSAEQAGFDFCSISDHFHPWTEKQGESPFVWSVIGAIAEATNRIEVITGVTCPTIRIHPAIVAQAAATSAALLPGRFSLGLGTGENLNEHILGDRWPPAAIRREMLDEAIDVIRTLWEGELTNHRGRHYTVENARIYSRPDRPPPILIAASGEKAVQLAGGKGDGLIALAPDDEVIERFESSGGRGKPRYCEVQVLYHEDEDKAKEMAASLWPLSGIPGELSQELPLPRHFEQVGEKVTSEDAGEKMACGPDPQRHIEMISKYKDAGYDHIWVHQIGSDQDSFFEFYSSEVLPRIKT